MKFFIAAALLISMATTTALAEIQLNFGVYTSDKPTTMVRMFRPILNTLEQQLTEKLNEPTTIRLQVAKSYEQGIDDLTTGKVDFARMGPASYVRSKALNSDVQLLAMESKNKSKTFFGIICINENSSIKDISQLKGKSFAFGNEQSTIGRYLSQRLLTKQNIYASDLSHYDYLGRHDSVASAVGAGRFDAGALKESTFNKMKAKGVKIRELARFPNVTKPWIAKPQLNKRVALAIKTALLELNDPAVLTTIKKDGFIEAYDSDYEIIRQAIYDNRHFF